MKKQLKRISKKIIIYSLIGSLIFTSVFSTRKIEAKAAAIAGYLSAYTLYEICLYLGGLAVTALGVGAIYDNRDKIAEFGKTIIDNMTALPEQGWMLGSYTADSSYVYGSEALKEVQDTSWTVIQGGGSSPKNDDDNDDDGDKDADDRSIELDMTGFFLTEIGLNYFNNAIKPIYDKWVNKEEDNILEDKYGVVDAKGFEGFKHDENGYYTGSLKYGFGDQTFDLNYKSTGPICIFVVNNSSTSFGFCCITPEGHNFLEGRWVQNGISYSDTNFFYETDLPVIISDSYAEFDAFFKSGEIGNISNEQKSYRVADWIAEDEYWKGYLEGIANSLRSLGDLVNIAQQLANSAYNNKPDAIAYGSMMTDLGTEYAPMEYPITDPVYWPVTNPTPKLDPSALPNYQPGTNPDPGINPNPGTGINPSDPDDPGGNDPDDIEIDLDGLLSLFTILIYIIMIIIMLIYLFLACLAFIVMIFRIPASSSMLPEEMVMGFEHLQTIMIPGMNISIYDFAMALIYLFIVFAVIKVLRHEINHFKIPRAFK